MHPDIQYLIEMALADGGVTEKERAIILRKADALGEDKDEVEMILDGRITLMQKDQNLTTIQPSSQKSNKAGTIAKCPACGAIAQSFSTKCPECGHEFRNIESAYSIKELRLKLEEAEEKARNSKPIGGLINAYLRLFDETTDLEKRIYDAKTNVLETYPIPNTKEDILEFLALSVAQINSIKIERIIKLMGPGSRFGYKITYKNAWLAIANKVILKARFSMKDDKKTMADIEYYENQLMRL